MQQAIFRLGERRIAIQNLLGSFSYGESYLKDYTTDGSGCLTLVMNLYQAGNRYTVLTVGYDRESLTDPSCPPYHGPVTVDHYGRRVPKAAHGSETLRAPTASSRELLQALTVLFDRIVDRGLLVRRMYVVANHVQRERDVQAEPEYVQLDLFADEAALTARREEQSARARERRMQDAVLAIREKYGKNAILKAMSLRDGATARQRNEQIGGHKA